MKKDLDVTAHLAAPSRIGAETPSAFRKASVSMHCGNSANAAISANSACPSALPARHREESFHLVGDVLAPARRAGDFGLFHVGHVQVLFEFLLAILTEKNILRHRDSPRKS